MKKKYNYENKNDLSSIRLTLDYKGDLIFLRKIFKEYKKFMSIIIKKFLKYLVKTQKCLKFMVKFDKLNTGQKYWMKRRKLFLVEHCYFQNIQIYIYQKNGQHILTKRQYYIGILIIKNT